MAETEIGKLARHYACSVRRDGWHRFVTHARGASNLTANVGDLPHKAARLLKHLRLRGAGVLTSTDPWTLAKRDAAVKRGAHKSAQLDREFVLEEMLDFCRQGYWVVLPYSLVRLWPRLRVSPIGAVPQRDRRPRLIVDYSFSGVNEETVQLAPAEAMQFGRALQRVIQRIVEADPRYGPVHMAKLDIADGFYRVWVQVQDVPRLGVVLPTSPGQPTVIAFPLPLPMGWVESPPYFTALTETSCDLANSQLRDGAPTLRVTHRLEATAATPPPSVGDEDNSTKRHSSYQRPRSYQRMRSAGRPPVAAVDVYVDDFLLLAQTAPQRRAVMRSALTAIDRVFRPLAPSDPPSRKEPASVKKMLQGEACWDTRKRLLGWELDTVRSTLQLPAHRLDRLNDLLDSISLPHRRVSVKRWHQLLGELRSMSPALPGSRGLFSLLQDSLRRAHRNRVRVSTAIWHMASDFRAIAHSLQQRPTRLPELVPSRPTYLGACDACGRGMGGVWFATDTSAGARPLLWRQAFSPDVQSALITAARPGGSISISDLELSALIAHKDVLARQHSVAERTIWVATDNRAALSWSDKGSSTSTAARAYLLRLNSLHQRQHRYVARHNHIAGTANVMADDASHRWDLSDMELLSHFTRFYPQASPWRILTLAPETNSALTGSLFKQRPTHEYLTNAPLPPTPRGGAGRPSATACPSTCITCLRMASPSCSSSPNVYAVPPFRSSSRALSHGGRHRPRGGPGVCRDGGPGPSLECGRHEARLPLDFAFPSVE